MRDFNILTPGEKIKSIRTKFDIRQEDITGGDITRNLISIIENNKANLTAPVAKILSSNINQICKERNIDFSVSEDYLLESVVSQAKKIADDYINYITNLDTGKISFIGETLNEIEIFLKTFPTEEKKAKLYIAIGRKLKLNKNYTKAVDYYLKAYESSDDMEFTSNSLDMLGACSMYLSKYEDALDFYNILINLNKDTRIQYHTKFNIGLCYKKLGKFQEALDILCKARESYIDLLSEDPKSYIKLNTMIGVCLTELKSFNKAITLYKDLLKLVTDDMPFYEIIILINLCDIYRTTRDHQKLEKTCSKIQTKLNDKYLILNGYEGDIYMSLAKNLNALSDTQGSLNLLLKALDSYKSGKSSIYLEDVEVLFADLLDIFTENKDDTNITYLKNELFELIEKNMYPRYSLVAFKFIKYYNTNSDRDEINNLIDFLAV